MAGLCGLSRLVGIFLQFCRSVYTLCLVGMCASCQVCLCVCRLSCFPRVDAGSACLVRGVVELVWPPLLRGFFKPQTFQHWSCLLVRVKARTPLDPWSTEEEEEYCRDPTRPRKVHCKTGWKPLKMLFIGSTLGEHKRKAPRFAQPKSHAIITNSMVPLDCIERAISQFGEMTIYLRSSILKSACNEQQQQRQQDV